MAQKEEKQRKSFLKNFYPKYVYEKVEDIPYDI